MLKGFTRRFKPLEILTEEQVEAIHRATLDVLWETGIRYESDWALDFFEKNECKVDRDQMRVRFPEGLVEGCLRKCPTSYRFRARDPKNDVRIGGNTLYFAQGPGMRIADPTSWDIRIPTLKEHRDAMIVADALPNLHIGWAWEFYMELQDVPPVMAMLEDLASGYRNSTKTEAIGYAHDNEIFAIQMAQALGTDIHGLSNPSPPLTFYDDAVQSARRMIEAGFPVLFAEGQVFGGTSPATLAGSVVTHNAELIAGIVLAQLIKPGAKVLADDFVLPMNMATGAPAFGQIGISLHIVMFNQIFRGYGIPIMNGCFFTNSKRIDFQNGCERTIMPLIAALSGANWIGFHGGFSCELAYSPIQCMLDDDVAGMIGRFIESVEINNETLALDLIEDVGPIPGHYLGTEHTRKWWQREQYVPKVFDRDTYPGWVAEGKKSCFELAKEKMEEILAAHKVSIPLTPSQEKDIKGILNEARQYYRKKGLISDEEWEVYQEKVLKSPDYPFA